jgi:hypothetical protein
MKHSIEAGQQAKHDSAREAFEAEYQMALDKNAIIRDAKRLSVPTEEGILAIHVAGHGRRLATSLQKARMNQRRMYAETIAARREDSNKYGAVVLRENTSLDLLAVDLNDPQVSDMLIISPGSIGTANLGKKSVSWLDIAKQVNDHHKRGKFETHMIGQFPEATPYAIPLGAFTVANVANLELLEGLTYRDLVLSNKEPVNPQFVEGIALKDQFAKFDSALRVEYQK